MRRLGALTLFTLGYLLLAAFDGSFAAAPCLTAFIAGGWLLTAPVLSAERA